MFTLLLCAVIFHFLNFLNLYMNDLMLFLWVSLAGSGGCSSIRWCSPQNFLKEWWRAGQALGQGGGRNVRDY